MAGAWQRGISLSNAKATSADYTRSLGAAITSNAATFTKGPWAQLIASTPTNTNWALIQHTSLFNNGSTNWAFDIGIGASGSEVVIVPNLIDSLNQLTTGAEVLIPLKIKAGTRVAARGSCEVSSDFSNVQVILFSDTYQSCGGGGSVTSYGFTAASNTGTRIDPGAASPTKGAYTQLSSGLTSPIAGFFMAFDAQSGGGNVGTVQHLIDVAVGGAGSEVVVLPNYQHLNFYFTAASSGQFTPNISPFFPIPLDVGSRVAIRANSTTNTTPDRYFGVTFYGVQQ